MTQADDSQGDSNITLLPPSTKINLHDSHAIRRELSSVYRDMRAGKIENGTQLAYVLNMLLRAYETCILQDKIEAIEGTINHREKAKNEEIKRNKNLR